MLYQYMVFKTLKSKKDFGDVITLVLYIIWPIQLV